jgi:hypothetical protein
MKKSPEEDSYSNNDPSGLSLFKLALLLISLLVYPAKTTCD